MKFKNSPNSDTLHEISLVLNFIRKHAPELIEKEGDSKWTSGHRVFAFKDDEPGMYTFMVGALKSGKVTWHIMPMYGVAEMKNRWSQVLSPFVSGKSCIQFKSFNELPLEALEDIVSNGTVLFQKEMAAYYAKKK